MLKRLGGTVDPKGAATAIKDAEFPVPFASELEFNSPVHGTWNIVHTGMQVPDAHQIYVCADNCMRGVVLTAAEMNEAERFSLVYPQGRAFAERQSGRYYHRRCVGCDREIGTKAESGFSVYSLSASFPGQRS